MEQSTGEQQAPDDGGSGKHSVGVLSRQDCPGPPLGWDPIVVAEQIRELAHDYPEHLKKRQEWSQRKPPETPKQCDWCEAHGKALWPDGGQEREPQVFEVDDEPDDEFS